MSLKLEWYAGRDKEEVIEMVTSARPTLQLLKKILEKKADAKLKVMMGKQEYDKASWPYYQADAVAEQRVLREIIELIDLTKEE